MPKAMIKPKPLPKPTAGDGYCPIKIKPYNRYNLFFILERELILQQNNPTYDPFEQLRAPDYLTGFEGIEMPSKLPERYSKLVLPPGWYLPGRNKRRSHKKSHGLLKFADLSKGVAQNYRTIDKETFNFLDAVAKSLLKRSREIKAKAELKSLPREIQAPSPPNVDVAHVPTPTPSSVPVSSTMTGAFPNVNVAHLPGPSRSVPVSSMTVAMMNRLEPAKSITQKPVQTSAPSGLEKKTRPPQPAPEAVHRVSNLEGASETNKDETSKDASMMANSRPVGTMQVDPRIIETMMLPADRPRTFIMTCVPCREDSETSVGSPSSASSVCSRSSSSSSSSSASVEDLSTSADICDHDIIRMWMSA
mmetsp:Transcript_614/g.1274  ORF Transcript_614/g.1274 Transcript_614/m.1274 type:complete len:362 (+) Transcript_614:37-1122(+)